MPELDFLCLRQKVHLISEMKINIAYCGVVFLMENKIKFSRSVPPVVYN